MHRTRKRGLSRYHAMHHFSHHHAIYFDVPRIVPWKKVHSRHHVNHWGCLIKDFFSKCDQIHSSLENCSLMGNFIFRAVPVRSHSILLKINQIQVHVTLYFNSLRYSVAVPTDYHRAWNSCNHEIKEIKHIGLHWLNPFQPNVSFLNPLQTRGIGRNIGLKGLIKGVFKYIGNICLWRLLYSLTFLG